MPKSPREMIEAVVANLGVRTGRDLAGWIELLERDGPDEPKARRAWLKDTHGLGSGQAMAIVEKAAGSPYDLPPERLLERQYEGREGLRPILERVLACARALGADVEEEVNVTYVTLRRGRKFAEVKPATRTRIDLGLALGAVAVDGRPTPIPGRKPDDRLTHRIALTRPEEVDGEVADWLRRAYEVLG
ncbi:MAG TPA: DUF5655 domain-containing protein [Azospirillaceae bacterium]|nr:DUF5655 domain-containing protein [Azospirillaceae bacterium]